MPGRLEPTCVPRAVQVIHGALPISSHQPVMSMVFLGWVAGAAPGQLGVAMLGRRPGFLSNWKIASVAAAKFLDQ